MEKRLNYIFLHRTGIDFEEFSDLQEKKLFGKEINLREREAVYILLDIQKEFDLVIPKQKIVNNEFSTYQGIKNIIEELLAVNNANDK